MRIRSMCIFAGLMTVTSVLNAAETGKMSVEISKLRERLESTFKSKVDAPGLVTVAIFEFETDERLKTEKVGAITAEVMTAEFSKSKVYRLVERRQLKQLIEEQKLGLMGYLDEGTAAKISKLIGAQYLLLGSVQELRKKYQINARLVDAETSEITAADYAEIPKNTFNNETGQIRKELESYIATKSHQILVLGGYDFFVGDFSDVVEGTTFGGLGYRFAGPTFGLEFAGDFAAFNRETSASITIPANVTIMNGIVSGLYYFGYPFQMRGYAKAGGGIARSMMEAEAVNVKLKSEDPIGLAGIGIDLSRNKRIGGIMEIVYRQIFSKGTDIQSIGVVLGLTFNW